MNVSSALCVVGGLLFAPSQGSASDVGSTESRYPTADEAFYVLACVEMNGQDADGLQKCSCAINAIEGQLSYKEYSDAVLVFSMRQAGGQRAAVFRDAVSMREIADRFISAQTRANRQCFGRDLSRK
jgi:hypothetical protein